MGDHNCEGGHGPISCNTKAMSETFKLSCEFELMQYQEYIYDASCGESVSVIPVSVLLVSMVIQLYF